MAVAATYVEKFGPAPIAVHMDYYWSIAPEQLADLEREPTGLTLGQISDNITWLTQVADDPQDFNYIHLVWLADLLRAIAYEELTGPASDSRGGATLPS